MRYVNEQTVQITPGAGQQVWAPDGAKPCGIIQTAEDAALVFWEYESQREQSRQYYVYFLWAGSEIPLDGECLGVVKNYDGIILTAYWVMP